MTTTPVRSAGIHVQEVELDDLSESLETKPASAIVRWAVDTFGSRICLTASMQDAVLIDIATKVDPNIEVVFIDTGYHFAETLQTLKEVEARYELNLRVMRIPDADPPLWQADSVNCCSAAKVEQLELALADKLAWMSGLRRVDAETRTDAPIIGRDSRGLVKVNPLANWTDDDVQGYIEAFDVPVNPLLDQGYPSVGCWPCTRPVLDGEHPRSGRWAGLDKTECGIHL